MVPFICYFGLSGVVYLAFGLGLQEFVSVLFLVPLLFSWIRTRRERSSSAVQVQSSSVESSMSVIAATLGLYVVVMTVRTPSVVFLGFPIEKTPLIYMLVLWIVFVKKRQPSDYGFRTGRLSNQIFFGTFLYLGSQLVPLFLGASLLVSVYSFNPLGRTNLLVLFGSLPFQILAVGISEEGFFRGYILTSMRRATGARTAILYQAILFGAWHIVWHLNPLDIGGLIGHVVGSFLFGVFAGIFYLRTRSIAGLAVFHGLTNSFELGLNVDLSGLESSAILFFSVLVGVLIITLASVLLLLSSRIVSVFKTGFQDDPALSIHGLSSSTDPTIGSSSACGWGDNDQSRTGVPFISISSATSSLHASRTKSQASVVGHVLYQAL